MRENMRYAHYWQICARICDRMFAISWHAWQEFVGKKLTKYAALKSINPLDSKGSHNATLNNTKLVHWPLMGGLLHLVQWGVAWAGCSPALAVPNVTAHPSTTSVPVTVLLFDDLLLCSFNVAIIGLILVAVSRWTRSLGWWWIFVTSSISLRYHNSLSDCLCTARLLTASK